MRLQLIGRELERQLTAMVIAGSFSGLLAGGQQGEEKEEERRQEQKEVDLPPIFSPGIMRLSHTFRVRKSARLQPAGLLLHNLRSCCGYIRGSVEQSAQN
jgi:hypothetical protein